MHYYYYYFLGSVTVHLSKQHFSPSMQHSIFQLYENREQRDLNPGLLGEKRERYLCAMPPPSYFIMTVSILQPSYTCEKSTGTKMASNPGPRVELILNFFTT